MRVLLSCCRRRAGLLLQEAFFARWVSRAGTADDEAATEYATALAAIARRQLSKNSSGGDGVAKPLRKKQHC